MDGRVDKCVGGWLDKWLKVKYNPFSFILSPSFFIWLDGRIPQAG
jgi:hypothetical protein